MATPSLDAYRQLNPQDTRPDSEVVPELISRLQGEGTVQQYPDLLQYAGDLQRAYAQAHRPDLIKEGINAGISGLETSKASLYNLAAQVGGATGADGLENFGMQGYQRSLEDATPYSPSVPSVGDVHNVSDAMHFGVGLAGSQAAPIATMMGAGAVGGIVGAATGPEGIIPGMTEGAATAAEALRAAAISRGAMAGVAGAGYLQSQNYAQTKLSGGQDPGLTSAAVGAAGGLLMTIVPSRIMRAAFGAESQDLAQMGVEQLLGRAEKTVPGLASSIVHGMAEHGFNNSLLGVGNELVTMAGELYSHRDDPSFEITDKELTDRILNGAAAGGALGAVFGAAGAPGERSKELEIQQFAKAKAAEIAGRAQSAQTKYLTQVDPYAGLRSTETTSTEQSPVDAALAYGENPQSHAPYGDLLDDDATAEEQKTAQDKFNSARTESFYQADRTNEAINPPVPVAAGTPPVENSRAISPEREAGSEIPKVVDNNSGKPLTDTTYEEFKALAEKGKVGYAPKYPGLKEGDRAVIDQLLHKYGGPTSQYHYELGKHFGYSDADVAAYLSRKEQTNTDYDSVIDNWTGNGLKEESYKKAYEQLTKKSISEPTYSGPTSTQLPGVIDSPGALEHGGDIPVSPDLVPRTIVPEQVPEMRKESTPVPSGAAPDEVTTLAGEGIRPGERTKNETKRMVAIKDNDTGRVTLYPIYKSTGNRIRVDNGVEAKVNSRRALANTLGVDEQSVMRAYKQGGETRNALETVWNELTKGSKDDQYLEDLLNEKSGGKSKYTALGFLDSTEPIGGKHYTFDSEERYRDETAYKEPEIVTKGNKGGGGGVPQVLDRLNKIAPRDSRALQILASVLETHKDLEHQASEDTRESGNRSQIEQRATSDASLLIRGLLTSGRNLRAEVFAEKLKNITDPRQLFKQSKGRYFGLFTPAEWDQWKVLTEQPNVSALDLLHAVDQGLEGYGWKSRGEYLRAITPTEGEKQLGAQLRENDAGKSDDEDNLSAKIVEASGREGSGAVMRAAEEALPDENKAHQDLPEAEEASTKEVIPERAQGFAGLTNIETEGLSRRLSRDRGEDSIAARDIMEARGDSEISNPKEDLEFQAVKKDLAGILDKIFAASRIEKPELTDDFLYGVYSNLDKIVRDSQPNKSTYRVTTDAIQRTFHNTVAWLADKGVDVRLVQQAVDSQVELLRNEWGRSISHEDGRRMVVVTMADLSEPSRDNLRVLMHEVSHQQFADEPVWIQRLMHEAVDRMNDLQLDVFGKSKDARISDTYTGRQYAKAGMPTGPKITLTAPEFMEEVLAEHLSHMGIDAPQARTLGQRLLGSLQMVIARAMLAYSQLRGSVLSPKWAVKYLELRFQDMLDKVVEPRTDIDTLTGTQRNTAKFKGTFYRPVGGDFNVERYDSASNQFVLHDVVDESALASEFNLDNKLSFSDVVIRDNRSQVTRDQFEKEFGVGARASKGSDVLSKIVAGDYADEAIREAASAINGVSGFGKEATIRFDDNPDMAGGNPFAEGSPAYYDSSTHEILINPNKIGGYTKGDFSTLVVHEMQHASTSRAVTAYKLFVESEGTPSEKAESTAYLLKGDGASPLEMARLKQDILRAVPAVDRLNSIFSHLSDKGFESHAYGMTNLDEFASEAMSNRTFQMALAKEILPDNLITKSSRKSAFRAIADIITRIFGGGEKGNALESALAATENLMMVADPLLRRASDGRYFAPVSEAESDARVKKDFEYEFAALNSQSDLYHSLFDKAAAAAQMDFDTYLKKVLGVYNPDESIRQLETKVGARSRPIQVNQDLRLNDSKGDANRVGATTDRAQLTKRMLETVSDAQGKLQAKMSALKDMIPRLERDHQRSQDRLVRFETMLHDVMAIRDNALTIMRKGLRGAERNAARLVQWSARHEGLAGIAAELFRVPDEDAIPADYADLLFQGVEDHQDDTFITDALTSAQKYNVDFNSLSPRDIETRIQEIARSTKDEHLTPLADGSPQARADLALLTYYAKSAPEDMAALEIRVEQDPERKDAILRTIQKIIRGNYEDTGGLNDLFKDVRSGDVKVGRAKQALTTALRSLRKTKGNLDTAKLRSTEMEKASGVLKNAQKPFQADIGIRAGRFEPYNGATILDTSKDIPSKTTLKLGPNSGEFVNKILMDNIKWLKTHDLQDATWHAVADQVEGLKKVAGEQIEHSFRDSAWTKRMGSIPERLNNIGMAILRRAGERIIRYHALRMSAEHEVVQGAKVTEDYRNAMKATGFGESYSGYKNTFFNPAFHFLRHLTLLPGEGEAENRQYAKDQLKTFFMRNEQTREAVTKPGAYDAIWKSLESNAKASKDVARKAAGWNVLVDDPDIKVENPRTGRVENAKRPAMDVGLMTTQSSITPIFGIKDLLENIKDQKTGEGLWSKWAQTDEQIDPKALFTDDALHHFVRPYIYDTGTLHLNAPELLDGKTKNKANPVNVQSAYESSKGDMTQFAKNLFDSEYTLQNEPSVDHNARLQKYTADTLDFFKKQYLKIYNMSEAQEQFNQRGLTADRFLASPMMDSIKAQDFPPEFVDYNVYDQTTLRNMLSQLAAHAALGTDLGLFSGQKDPNGGIMWELAHGEAELKKQQAQYNGLAAEVLRDNPRASVKEIDAAIAKKIGKDQLEKLQGIVVAKNEIEKSKQQILDYLMSPNGATRDMQLAQSGLGFLVSGMVNNFKSAMNQVYQAFEPFSIYGIGKTGWKQAFRSIEATARSGAGSFVQAVSGEASLASNYARFMAEHGLGMDPANEVTSSQIMADNGKNNVYENQKLLGWLRKGRSLAFDTGFRGAEGERIAPKFRPQAPFSMSMIATNQGAIESDLRLYNDVLKRSMEVMKAKPGATDDPSFEFSNNQLQMGGNMFDRSAFDELHNQFRIMGTTLEIETRNLINAESAGKPLGEIVVPPDLARLISGEALRRMSLPVDIASAPIWMQTSQLGRLAMPLISWSLNKTNQIVGMFKEPNGEATRRAMIAGIASLAVGMVPAAVAVSLVLDQYDEQVLGKKSNLTGFNFDSPSQTAVALMDRVGRVGTFGLGGDLVNGIRTYGTSGDLRGISVDQRVVFVNTLMSLISLSSTAYNQEGTLTYDSFYRPLINTMGGGGILQNQQILNNVTNSLMGVPVFSAEAETTARLNALNYLRGAGRVTGLDERTGAGQASMPTPIKPWVSEMAVAAYSGDSSKFVEAYRKAILAAQEEGKDDPQDYVKRAFESMHPLRSTFQTPPTKVEVAQMMGAMSDKGRQDVSRALEYFNSYSASLGIKPYDGRELVTARQPKGAGPNPWGTASTKSPWQ